MASLSTKFLEKIQLELQVKFIETFEIPTNQTDFATKDVTKITGMTKDALRYYEKLGILKNIQRDQNNYRHYSRHDLERLRFVKIFQYLDLDLSLLAADNGQLTPADKIAELKNYQQKVHQEQDHLAQIDQFLSKKITYFESLK